MSDASYVVTSAALFLASLYTFKKTYSSRMTTLIYFLTAFSSIILLTSFCASHYFTGKGITQATIFHIRYGFAGAGFLEYLGLIIISVCLLLLGTVFLFIYIFKNVRINSTNKITELTSYSLLLTSFAINPATIDIYKLASQASIDIQESATTLKFNDYYKLPNLTSLRDSKKNIIFIYAESLERTYFDETIFPGLITGLRELEKISTYFTNITQVEGTGWTIGGITASLCGIPLYTPSHGNSMSGMDSFLPLAVAFTDLLASDGYNLTYMGGANLDFAGKGKMFKTHGFNKVLGLNELLPKMNDKTYLSTWGIYDDTLLDMVYEHFLEKSSKNEKFGIFTLTLDTHAPNGHMSKTSKKIKYKNGSNPMLNAVAGSDYLVSNLINKILQSPYAHKSLIVLVSDHIALRNKATHLLNKKDRKNLFMIIDPSSKKSKEIKTGGSTLDISPTILPFIGYKGEIGLGRNLLENEEDIKKDLTNIQQNTINWRNHLIKFWDFPRIQNYIKINIDSESMSIDNRKFKLPVLIELNEKLETTLKFEFYNDKTQKTLIEHIYSLDENKPFLLIDRYKNIRKFDLSSDNNEYCLAAGKGKQLSKVIKVNKNSTFTRDEINSLLGF